MKSSNCSHPKDRQEPVVNFAKLVTNNKPMSRCLDCGKLLLEGREFKIKVTK